MINLKIVRQLHEADTELYIIPLLENGGFDIPEQLILSKAEQLFTQEMLDKKIHLFTLPRSEKRIFIHFIKVKNEDFIALEEYRSEGAKISKVFNKHKFSSAVFVLGSLPEYLLAYTEGFILSDYRFEKYKTEKEESTLGNIYLLNQTLKSNALNLLKAVTEAVYIARDLINEPGSELTAVELAKQIVSLGKKDGFYTEVFNMQKIKALKMGGLLSVNKGSIDPPTFSILEWKPEKAINSKPLILIGKGVVFDTGGLSLKPTPNSMDYMKSDMSGAAAVIGVVAACARAKLDLHIIGLIPATDNRPGERAYLPGDVVKMYDGTTVEVLNTDAEGRMILADALTYAKKYEPEMVIDVATLTGAAAVAIGKYGIVAFTNKDNELDKLLLDAGKEVYERLVEFPMWDEYADLIKSDIADVKNIGGKDAGAITAAKFLEKFTNYPWVHLDIAGAAFHSTEYKYYTKGGSGAAVRLLFKYLCKKAGK